MNSLIGTLMKKPRCGEINEIDVSVPIGTTQDKGINAVCSVIIQMHHRQCERMFSDYDRFKY